jgi:hypothetical protein
VKIDELEPAVQKAYVLFELIQQKAERRLEDPQAYKLVKEELPDEFLALYPDYKLPTEETWKRYLGDARRLLDEHKYTRRAGRSGRSTVNASQLDTPSEKQVD